MTRIVVVNDDTVFLDMMASVLRDHGWDVDVCREGDGAFELHHTCSLDSGSIILTRNHNVRRHLHPRFLPPSRLAP